MSLGYKTVNLDEFSEHYGEESGVILTHFENKKKESRENGNYLHDSLQSHENSDSVHNESREKGHSVHDNNLENFDWLFICYSGSSLKLTFYSLRFNKPAFGTSILAIYLNVDPIFIPAIGACFLYHLPYLYYCDPIYVSIRNISLKRY